MTSGDERQQAQMSQRGTPGAEIVHRKAHSKRRKLLETGDALLEVFHEGVLRDLEYQLPRRQVVCA